METLRRNIERDLSGIFDLGRVRLFINACLVIEVEAVSVLLLFRVSTKYILGSLFPLNQIRKNVVSPSDTYTSKLIFCT